ncbi:hypothetical protein MLD38_013818 [Melastoma candidum]|uniref:Uncharacterized protein n=1 Tax=Melastoma candidum TaxID=119954 RepID=A0ACB9RAS5_9MYRT|nr:hypothetical protein MLD38_013818 [Melastoma candidum]
MEGEANSTVKGKNREELGNDAVAGDGAGGVVADEVKPVEGGGGGWGGWGFSSLSILSDLQKAAGEISRNAAEVAKSAAKTLSEIQPIDEESDPSKEEASENLINGEDKEDESEKLRKLALDKLENASEDTVLGQGLKVLDKNVENLASGAWHALGSAWKGLETSAANFAESIQQGGLPTATGSVAPSLLETGKAFTFKGIQVLERVGKETMDLLISETGIEVDKNSSAMKDRADDDHLFEEVSFDRCFYIYGGPEQLEELESLSNHYALLFNRRKAKLASDQKSLYDGKFKEVQQIFDIIQEIDGVASETDKGKKVEAASEGNDDEIRSLHNSSVNKAAEMAAGFTNAISGLPTGEMIQRTASRLEALHSEGVHRLSEMCCFAVSQLLMLGKSLISNANGAKDEDNVDLMEIEWPEDSAGRAKIIRIRAQSMTGYAESISRSFVTGISDVAEAYLAALKVIAANSDEVPPKASIQEKAEAFSEHIRTSQTTAVSKIQDGLQYLSYVVISCSMPSA